MFLIKLINIVNCCFVCYIHFIDPFFDTKLLITFTLMWQFNFLFGINHILFVYVEKKQYLCAPI